MDELDLGQTIRGFAAGQKLFSRYNLVRILGRGGMGVVWLAWDEQLDREVALKFLPDLLLHDRGVIEGLKRETKRSLALTHPHIVRIYDFVQDSQTACISMEYVDGDTLSSLRADKQNQVFETKELQPYVEQLCEALDYAHTRAKIVHRDLKPSNLMVNSQGELKITDFGIARSLTDSVSMMTMARGTSGTLVYMSPQQLDGEKPSHLDDVYSVGATLYELLTSKPPFHSGGIERQIHEKMPPLVAARREELEVKNASAVPANWEQTISACLAKDPAQRPQSAVEIRKRLGDPNFRPVAIPRKALTVSKPRRKVVAVVVAAAAVVLLGAADWYFADYLPRESARKAEAARLAEQSRRALEERKAAEHLANARGSALIRTEPAGATVTLGDQAEKSPATFNGVKIGSFPLKIELEGYEPIKRQAEIKENEIADPGTIKLERSTGDAEIRTNPDGIEFDLVDADGNHHSGKTPQTLTKLPAGRAKLTFKPPASHQTEEFQVLPHQTASQLFVVTLPTPASAPSSTTTVSEVDYQAFDKSAIEAQLKDLENKWEAALKSHDIATNRRVLAEDFSGVIEGKVYDKSGYVARVARDRDTYTSATLEKQSVHIYSPTMAVVTGTAHEKGNGKDGKYFDNRWRFTDTWVKRDDRWQCSASQTSRVSP
jgi:ketosteroid isomerase-like protein